MSGAQLIERGGPLKSGTKVEGHKGERRIKAPKAAPRKAVPVPAE